ncbi:unnamed protein product [Anisakis simplex]|uniref:Uncharacterized protein n=1 Tax=Anisakis simplex TaxID=6269 RepID=A0A158PMY0_ANISI|nr:unnamed protein product [Anisakis simplex]
MIVSGCSSSGSNSTSATEQQSKTPSLSISSSRSDRHISNSSRTSTSNHNNAIDNQNNSSLIYTPHLNSPQIYQAPQRRIASLYGDGRSWLTTAGSSVHSSAVIRGANIASGSSSTSPLMSSVSNTRLNDSLPSRYTATSNFSKVMNQNQINRTDNNRPVSSSSLLSNSMYNNYNRPNMNAMSNQRILSPFNGTVHRPYAVQPNRLRAAVSTDNFSTNRFSNQLDYNENNYGGRYPPPPYHVASRFSREAHSRFLAPNALDAKRLQKFQSPSFSTNNNVALGSGGELRNGRSGAEPQRAVATVKLASPDSWMRNCTTRPISPSVPHNFNPNWRRSALAYPEYNQPSDTMKEEDNKDRKEIENRSGEKYGSHQAVNISASNKGIIPINIRTTSNDNNIVKMRNDSTAQKDSNKRHAGSNWEQEFIEESDENGNIPVQFYNPEQRSVTVTSQQRADINTSGPSSKFGRFAPRQASFIAAISGTERNTINNSDSHNNNQTSQLSQSSKQQQVMTVLPASAPSYRLSAGIAVQDECARRTPPSYVLNGKVGGASPPSVTRITLGSSYTMKPTSATTSQPPQSSSSSTFRNTAHRLLCGASRYGSSDDHSSSPIPYESSSSSVQLKSYDELDDNGERVENADGNNGAPRCVEQIANSNNYLRMTKQLRRHDKSAQQRRHLRLSAPSFLTSSATATDWAQSTSFQSNSQQHRHECYYPQKPPLPEQARDHLRRPNSTTHGSLLAVLFSSFI